MEIMKFKDWFIKKEKEEKKINEAFRDCDYCHGTGVDPNDERDECPDCHGEGGFDEPYRDWYGDDEGDGGYGYAPPPRARTKKPKEEKKFEVGDELILIDDRQSSKMPQDAYDFLKTYKSFIVRSINDKGKINLGCRISKNENGVGVEKIYMFSTDRFDLKNPKPKAETETKPESSPEPEK